MTVAVAVTMSLVIVFAPLVVILEGMERAADVALDLQERRAALGGSRRVYDLAGRIDEPAANIHADRGVFCGFIYDEWRVEFHLDLRAHP